jgi:translation initiation factor 2 subunit 1
MPLCKMLTVAHTRQYAAVERLGRAIESIQGTIEELGGALVIKMKVRLKNYNPARPLISPRTPLTLTQPKAISETEEQDLVQLMAKAGKENAEVSGDEDEEEGI